MRRSSIYIVIASLVFVSSPAMAKKKKKAVVAPAPIMVDIPLPRPRPPQAADLDAAAVDIVPVPVYAHETIKQYPYIVSIPPAIAAEQAHADALKVLEAQKKADAETLAATKEADAVAKRVASDEDDTNAIAWDSQVKDAKANTTTANTAVSDFEKEYNAFVLTLGKDTPAEIRAQLADQNVTLLSVRVNASYYAYKYTDAVSKSAQAWAIAQKAKVDAAQAEYDAILDRNAANAYFPGATIDFMGLAKAKVKLDLATTASGKATTTSTDSLDPKAGSIDSYREIKKQLEDAQALAKFVAQAVKDYAASKKDADTQRGLIKAADDAVAMAIQIGTSKKGPKITAEKLAASRANIAEKKLNAANVKVLAIPVLQKESDDLAALEKLVIPLTPNFSDDLKTQEKARKAAVAQQVDDYNGELKAAKKVNKLAVANQQSLDQADVDFAAQLQVIEQLTVTQRALEAKLKTLTNSIASAIQSASLNRYSDLEPIAQLRSAIADTQADIAINKKLIADETVKLEQMGLDRAQIVADLDQKLLDLVSLQVKDSTEDFKRALSAATAAAKEAKQNTKDLSALAKSADAQSNKITEAVKNAATASQKYMDAYRVAMAQRDLVTQVKADGKKLLAEHPDVVTLATVRLNVAEALLKQTTLWQDAVTLAALENKALTALNEVDKATDEKVSAIVPYPHSDRTKIYDSAAALGKKLAGDYDKSIQALTDQRDAAKDWLDEVTDLVTAIADSRTDLIDDIKATTPSTEALSKEQKKYDAIVNNPASKDKDILAERIVLDRARAKSFAAFSDVAASKLATAKAIVELDESIENVDPRVAALYVFDLQKYDKEADIASRDALQIEADKAASSQASAEKIVISSLAAARTLPRRAEAITEAQTALEKDKKAADEAAAALAAAKKATEDAKKEATQTSEEIANRPKPTVLYSDSQIKTYLETLAKNKDFYTGNAVDTAALKSDYDKAELDEKRADIVATKAAFDVAGDALMLAKAKYTYWNQKRDGSTSAGIAKAYVEMGLGQDSVNAAHLNVMNAFDELYQKLTEAIQNKTDYLNALKNSSDATVKKLTQVQSEIDALTKEQKGLLEAKATENKAEIEIVYQHLDDIADHGEALNRMASEISLEDLADEKYDQLVGHHCTRYDTDPITCLACNAYYEAGIDKSFNGKLLPPRSVMVRLNLADPIYGKSVCGIVHFRRKGTCAYSWSCERDTKNNNYHRLPKDVKEEVLAALIAYYEVKIPYSYDSYWNASIVHPYWAGSCKVTVKIGLHTACRVLKTIDYQGASEDALMRDFEDHVQVDSIQKVMPK